MARKNKQDIMVKKERNKMHKNQVGQKKDLNEMNS
jgi:hypothetical protein